MVHVTGAVPVTKHSLEGIAGAPGFVANPIMNTRPSLLAGLLSSHEVARLKG